MQVTDAPPVRSMLASPPGRSMGPENRRRKRVLEDGAPALGIVTSGKRRHMAQGGFQEDSMSSKV
eukprot:1956173-Pleurochrysis_carterae.AAC.1